MKQIDCRMCRNCDPVVGCKKYGEDKEKAMKACADNGFRDFKIKGRVEKNAPKC